jgi:hypothetical protein
MSVLNDRLNNRELLMAFGVVGLLLILFTFGTLYPETIFGKMLDGYGKLFYIFFAVQIVVYAIALIKYLMKGRK